MKIKNFLFAATFLAAVLTGCSDNDSPEPAPNPEPELGANLSVALMNPTPTTYVTDENATASEMKITQAQVFIYQNGTLAGYRELEGADFQEKPTSPTQNLWTYNYSVQIPTGDGIVVYVGVNVPKSISDLIRGNGFESGIRNAYTIAPSLMSKDNEFIMFSLANDLGYVQEGQTASVIAAVERLTSKISVVTAPDLLYKVAGGTVQPNIEFTVNNLNNKSYLVKRLTNGVITDPNYSYNLSYDADFTDDDVYINVPVKDVLTVQNLPVKYAPENTVDHKDGSQITYASIKTIFIPDTIVDGSGNFKSEPSAPVTFYTAHKVANNPSLGFNYFDDYDEAVAYAGSASRVSAPYVGGLNYYSIHFNNNSQKTSNLFGVIRNDFYQATIRTISGLGNPNPGPIDPEEVTDLDVIIDIIHWKVVESDYDI